MYKNPVGGKTQNEHLRARVTAAHARGLLPEYALCDRGYSSLDHLKPLRPLGWAWLTRLQSHRQVSPDRSGNVAIRDFEILPQGRQVHLRGYGFVRVFRTVADHGYSAYWASSDLNLTPARRQELALQAWANADYHRGLKQGCGVERVQVPSARAHIAHMGFALRAWSVIGYVPAGPGTKPRRPSSALPCTNISQIHSVQFPQLRNY